MLSPQAAETLRVLVPSAPYQIYALTAALIALRRQTSQDIPPLILVFYTQSLIRRTI